MSTSMDLEFRENPPRIDNTLTLPPIRTLCALNSRSDNYHSSRTNTNDDKESIIAVGGAATAGGEEDTECRTPTSSEHKIPQVLECPPAPRKPRRTSLGKRKASELRSMEFFDVVNREEVEDLFRRLEQCRLNNPTSVVKRRSSCKGFVVQFR
ncbi:cyclin-dependent protein kinase inhibitor SIM-like [Punica granatum]|uniref:Cyclin-dependent protein kinase inhibitor SIM-like n=1 Tax=Punica granatum TaxID=22663 RepID=A0A218XRN8_PUNGR|nr:cyclin-dependent protein kinase inhibitor SIM-like [Punica granatum]OWM87623.1 hypothetical protein CDL15_Pgr022736 [Punica granatum]